LLNKLEFCGSLRPPKSLHAFFKNHPREKNLVHNTFQIIDSCKIKKWNIKITIQNNFATLSLRYLRLDTICGKTRYRKIMISSGFRFLIVRLHYTMHWTIRAVFKWLSKTQNQSDHFDQSQQEQTAPWTNQNS